MARALVEAVFPSELATSTPFRGSTCAWLGGRFLVDHLPPLVLVHARSRVHGRVVPSPAVSTPPPPAPWTAIPPHPFSLFSPSIVPKDRSLPRSLSRGHGPSRIEAWELTHAKTEARGAMTRSLRMDETKLKENVQQLEVRWTRGTGCRCTRKVGNAADRVVPIPRASLHVVITRRARRRSKRAR